MSKVYLCCSCVGPDRLPLLVTSKPYEHGDLHVFMCHVPSLHVCHCCSRRVSSISSQEISLNF